MKMTRMHFTFHLPASAFVNWWIFCRIYQSADAYLVYLGVKKPFPVSIQLHCCVGAKCIILVSVSLYFINFSVFFRILLHLLGVAILKERQRQVHGNKRQQSAAFSVDVFPRTALIDCRLMTFRRRKQHHNNFVFVPMFKSSVKKWHFSCPSPPPPTDIFLIFLYENHPHRFVINCIQTAGFLAK